MAPVNILIVDDRIEAGKFNIVRSPNNLYELVSSVCSLLKFKADKKGVELFLEIEPQVPKNILVDSLRLNQILMNLLSNAVNFTDRGYVKLKVAVLKHHSDKVKLKFNVEDTGIGIPADRLSGIFESFEQADDDTASRYGGTGLGLTIVKKLVELKGGDITVSTQVGKGSVFSFTNWFSIVEGPKKAIPEKPGKTLAPFYKLNVLVAEDNMVNQFMLSKMLKDWEVQFDMVDNGRKAIDKLKQNNYDLLLMDTHMPEMNGYETTKSIRFDFEEPKRSIPIISLSAAMLDHEHNEAIATGMNDVLSKPFQPYQLHEKIEKLIKDKALIKKPA